MQTIVPQVARTRTESVLVRQRARYWARLALVLVGVAALCLLIPGGIWKFAVPVSMSLALACAFAAVYHRRRETPVETTVEVPPSDTHVVWGNDGGAPPNTSFERTREG